MQTDAQPPHRGPALTRAALDQAVLRVHRPAGGRIICLQGGEQRRQQVKVWQCWVQSPNGTMATNHFTTQPSSTPPAHAETLQRCWLQHSLCSQ